MHYRYYWLGLMFKVLNLVIFTAISLGFLSVSRDISVLNQFFVVYASGTVILLPWVLLTRAKYLCRPNFKLYFVRAVISVVAMMSWIQALKYMGTNESALIGYTTPLFTILLASWFSEERVDYTSLAVAIICFFIIAFALQTELRLFTLGFIFAFISSIAWAFYNLICKKQTRTEHYLTQAFYTFAASTIITSPFVSLAAFRAFEVDMLKLLFIAFLRVANLVCIFLSFKFAPVSALMPVNYLQLVFMMIGTYLVMHVAPSVPVMIAGLTIICINMWLVKSQKAKMRDYNQE
ncbi:S-adenosylmethionine uptake transporter [Alphaproteobacteria bacterium]